MKKLILFLMILSGISLAQTNFFDRGSGFWMVDSLWNSKYIPDTVFAISGSDTLGSLIDTLSAQTTVEIPLNYNYDWLSITAIDTGTTYTDSCIVEYGVPSFSRIAGKLTPTDTIWQRVQFMRDSSWTNTNLIPDNASVRSYQIYVGDYEVIRVRMTNAVLVNNRIWKFYAQASKKK